MRIERQADGSWAIVYDDGRTVTGFRSAGDASLSLDALVASSVAPAATSPASGVTSDPAAITAAITASTVEVPARPPDAWFENPGFTVATTAAAPGCSDVRGAPLSITDDGHVFGHIALWNSCHNGDPAGPGICVPPPRSTPGYGEFRRGHVITASGARVATGPLTVGTGHAPLDFDLAATLAHYDNTATATADVVLGDDDYGVWASGTIRPGATVAQVEALRRSPISGDWRVKNGRHELVAALAVNTPGYGVPQYGIAASAGIPQVRANITPAGEMTAIVAAGAGSLAAIAASPWTGPMEEIRALVDDLRQAVTPLVAAAAREKLEAALA